MLDRKNDSAFVSFTFPMRLYALLEEAESQGFQGIIAWQPGGGSFKVHEQDVFAKGVMQAYFAQTKFKSFQRQLNMYGWKQVQVGPNKGGYQHKLFLRGRPDLLNRMDRRQKRKIQAQKSGIIDANWSLRTSLDMMLSEPTLVTTEGKNQVLSLTPGTTPYYESTTAVLPIVGSNNEFYSLEPNQCFGTSKSHDGIMTCFNPSNKVHFDDALTDELNNLIPLLDEALVEDNDIFSNSLENVIVAQSSCTENTLVEPPAAEDELSFPYRLHLMLEAADRENYSHIVSWVQNGTAFKVHDRTSFVEKVMPIYFDQSKYESFRRQLNFYQFFRVNDGRDRGVVWHPSLIRGSRHLCKNIRKKDCATIISF